MELGDHGGAEARIIGGAEEGGVEAKVGVGGAAERGMGPEGAGDGCGRLW